MDIKLTDLTRTNKTLQKKILQQISHSVRQGRFILGPNVKRFENDFAKYLNTKYCVGLSSGTSALEIACELSQLSRNDEIIVPSMTFVATLSPFLHRGVKPILVDTKEDLPLIDDSKIEQVVSKKTKVIVPVHMYGLPCNMNSITKISKHNRLKVIEDACQAHGVKYHSKHLGTIGDFGTFSFYPSKNLGAFGDAGALVMKKSKDYKKALVFRDQGQIEKYKHVSIGANCRIDELQAIVLLHKLKHLDRNNKKRQKAAEYYTKCLEDIPLNILTKPNSGSNFHLFVVSTNKRDKLLLYLKKHKIFCGIHYPLPLHLQPALIKLGYKKGSFPNAERHAKQCLSLPMFPEIKRDEIEFVSEKIKQFFAKK